MPRLNAALRLERNLTTADIMRQRAERVAPLFTWLSAHGIRPSWLARKLSTLRGETYTRSRMSAIKSGISIVPAYFVEDACEILGAAMHTVMGPAWQPRPRAAAHPEEPEEMAG